MDLLFSDSKSSERLKDLGEIQKTGEVFLKVSCCIDSQKSNNAETVRGQVPHSWKEGCLTLLLRYSKNTQMKIEFFMLVDDIATFSRDLMECAG